MNRKVKNYIKDLWIKRNKERFYIYEKSKENFNNEE